ncbi:hypothetical protein DCAR_0934407 [Daucus carota subsp. sativus]|uniref:Uncharacterized protein n=1 Tax=Daucus carota subsp. sativus TaxID=79200 RepID=A0AAF0XXL9_DAUCS|nr:hypothetical protein DCAR_0934407 [Daucus carota subsp. sativus]
MIKKWRDQPKVVTFDRNDAHLRTLDDLVNVNSLFTLAVFVGLSQAAPGARSLENRQDCDAGPGVAKMLVLYEVVAFACFLLSSLVAKVLKLHLSLDGLKYDFVRKGFDLKDALLIITACASVSGIILLTLSVVNIIQIRIGLTRHLSLISYGNFFVKLFRFFFFCYLKILRRSQILNQKIARRHDDKKLDTGLFQIIN